MQQAMSDTVRVEADGRRGALTLTDPHKLNPLGLETLEALTRAAAWFNEIRDLRVVVVAGEGRAFSAGADLSAFEAEGSGVDSRDRADAGRRMADAMERIEAVTVAKIRGHCVGGGLVLASTCDLRVASAGTSFFIPEVDLGIPLAWGGIPRLVREIGPAMTKELVMTCRPFDAEEAKAIGFLNRVVPDDQLDTEVERLVEVLVEKPRLALLATKRHTNAVTTQMVGTGGSWSDADGLLAGLADSEGRESAERYMRRVRKD